MPATDFTAGINRLLAQISHWEQPRWSTPVPPDSAEAERPRFDQIPAGAATTRADVVHALVQHLADLSADAEHRPHREVPREHDLVLPDQLRVMAADLLAASPSQDLFTQAAQAVHTTHDQLP